MLSTLRANRAWLFAIALVIVVFWTLSLLGLPAKAQEAVAVVKPDGSTVVSFKPLWDGLVPYIVAAIGAVIAGLGTWAVALLQRMTGIKASDAARERIQSAAMTGVNLGLAKVGDKLGDFTVDVKSEVLAEAAQWVQRSVPDSLKRLGITEDDVRQLVESKLPVAVAVAASPATAASVAAATTAAVPPAGVTPPKP